MRAWQSSVVGVLALLFSFAACNGFHAASDAGDRTEASPDYMALLKKFPVENQGRGVDLYDPQVVGDHATAYAQVLSSEAYRYSAIPNEESANRIRLATRWLIENSDLDGDGKKGWGLPFAWDAFGDNSVNPVDHPYTIDTAIVLLGLLDALDTRGIWSDGERQEIVRLVKSVLERWCTECWTESGGMRGFFWYSPSASDSYFLANVSTMLCAVLQRFIHEFGNDLSTGELALFRSRVEDGITLVEDSVVMFEGMPFWHYCDSPGCTDLTNDLVHHVYILYGIRVYREYGGQVPVRWTAKDALRSLYLFTSGGVIYNNPQDPYFANGRIDLKRPATLWGLGMLIAYSAAGGDVFLASSTLETIQASYGNFPDVTVYPLSWSSDARFYPRYAAHVLFGLAVRDFQRGSQTTPLTEFR
jgi:hypothetical protein